MRIIIENLSKEIRKARILDGISMELENGKIYGLTGRNGSGKTMLLRAICGLIYPSGGKVEIDGKIIGKDLDVAENCGILIESPGFIPGFTAYRNLEYLAMIKNTVHREQIMNALKLVGLEKEAGKQVGRFSMGMRQRLGLAQALMEDPELLLLDEPMNGLDDGGVREIRGILLQLKSKGRLVVVASHSLEDIGLLCDEVFRLDRGSVAEHVIHAK